MANGNGFIIQTSTPILTLTTTQRVTVGANRRVRIDTTAQAVWFKVGDAAVNATAGTAGESLCAVGDGREFVTGPLQVAVALIEHAAGAKASVTILG